MSIIGFNETFIYLPFDHWGAFQKPEVTGNE